MSETLWESFQAQYKKDHLSHAFLLLGALHSRLDVVASRMIALLLCKETNSNPNNLEACGHCQSCRLLSIQEHPDLITISLEKEKSTRIIPIEKIRNLLDLVYITPMLSKNRVITINPADKMNIQASNALLKILEEPPKNTYFFLIAEHSATIPATIISRCQRWSCESLSSEQESFATYKMIYTKDKDSKRGKILEQSDKIIQQLHDLLDLKTNIHILAAAWSVFELEDFIWFLYILHAQMIRHCFQENQIKDKMEEALVTLAKRIKIRILFKQIDKLNDTKTIMQETSGINTLLFLEDFLLAYA